MEDFNLTKTCHRCHINKNVCMFNKCKTGMMGLHNHCRECQKIVKREWYLKNRDKVLLELKTEEYKRLAREKRKIRYHSDINWKNQKLEKNRIRRRLEPVKQKCRLQRDRWLSIPKNRIAHNLRTRIRQVLNGHNKSKSSEILLGCKYDELKLYIESKFISDMNWDNYGKVWHIDHIIPCNFFDLENEYHQKLCFNFRNLQPMMAIENLSKNNKITIDDFQEFLTELKNNVV